MSCFNQKFRKKCKKRRPHRSGYFCNTYIIYICSLLQSIGNGSMYKDLDSNKRNQHWDETLLTYDFQCSFFLKTRCPVHIQIQRIHTRAHKIMVTTARDEVMTLRMPVYLRCPATVAGFLTTQSFTPFSRTYHHPRSSLFSVWYEISWRRRYFSEVNFEWRSSSWDQTWQLRGERWTSWHVGWLGTSR